MTDDVHQLERGDYVCLYLGPKAYDQVPPGAVERLEEQGVVRLFFSNRRIRHLRADQPKIADVTARRSKRT